MQTPKCLRCGSEMALGFLKDGQHGNVDVARWIEGEVRRGFFGGVKMPPHRDQLPVQAYRCRKCGWLDLFAEPAPGWG